MQLLYAAEKSPKFQTNIFSQLALYNESNTNRKRDNMSNNNVRYLIMDESGNLGASGRYFVIACIDTTDRKALHNIMKRKLGIARKIFTDLKTIHSNEIKANEAFPAIKYHILECIVKKDLSISYIVVDLHYIKPRLLEDKNILYNYITKVLLDKLITKKDCGSTIKILCDQHTTKVTSTNSFADYIKTHFIYDKSYDLTIDIKFLDSNANDAYIIQAADYVANAIYSYYEYGESIYYNILKNSIRRNLRFPWKKFGK